MNELQEKLRKRRMQCEDGGVLLFDGQQPVSTEDTQSSPEKAPASKPPTSGISMTPMNSLRTMTPTTSLKPMTPSASLRGEKGVTDLEAVLARRRRKLEEDAETFESKPTMKTADCVNEVTRQLSVAGKLGGGGDLRSKIDQQRAHVDDGSAKYESQPVGPIADCGHNRKGGDVEASNVMFESKPIAQTADCGHDRTSSLGNLTPERQPVAKTTDSNHRRTESEDPNNSTSERSSPEKEQPLAEAEAPIADCKHDHTPDHTPAPTDDVEIGSPSTKQSNDRVSPGEEQTVAELQEPINMSACTIQVETAEPVAENAQANIDTEVPSPTAALPTPSRAISSQICQDAHSDVEEVHLSDEHESISDGDDDAESEHPNSQQEERIPKLSDAGRLTMQEHRISWLVDLKVLADVFESPSFAIGSCEPFYFQLRPCETGCQLSLHGSSTRPKGMRARLFVAKGWKKKADKEWHVGHDLVEKFNVNLLGRKTLLCGLSFQEMLS